MTFMDWATFQYHATGWSVTNREAGSGQSGYASIHLTTAQSALYGFNSSHFIMGFCWRGPVGNGVVYFEDPAVGAGINQVSLEVEGNGALVAKRSNSGVEVGRSRIGLIVANAETYIEVRIKMSSAGAGEFEVRVNGDPTPVIDATGVTTGTISVAKEAVFSGPGAGDNIYLSAWYYLDVDATLPNDFLGHIRFGIMAPTGNGANSDLVGSDANSVNNYQLVDDPPLASDGDATYVQSPTVGDKDTYAMADLPTPALSVIGVGTLIVAKKTDAGTRAIKPVIRSGGTDYQGATEHFLGTSYVAHRQMWLEDPDTAAEWDEAGINAMEAGVEVTT